MFQLSTLGISFWIRTLAEKGPVPFGQKKISSGLVCRFAVRFLGSSGATKFRDNYSEHLSKRVLAEASKV